MDSMLIILHYAGVKHTHYAAINLIHCLRIDMLAFILCALHNHSNPDVKRENLLVFLFCYR